MTESPGKKFERKFAESLKRLPGQYMRIYDGGGQIIRRVWGDFFYFNKAGHVYLIECKSTQEASFRLRNIRDTQVNDLLKFDGIAKNTHSLVAIHLDRDDTCTLLTIGKYIQLARQYIDKKASIPAEAIKANGTHCHRITGGWNLEILKGAPQ